MFLFNILGLSGVLSSVAKVFASVVESLTPLFKGFFEGVVWYIKTIFEGLKDIFDSFATVLTVFSIVLFLYFYLPKIDNTQVEKEVVKEIIKECPKLSTKTKTNFSKKYNLPLKSFNNENKSGYRDLTRDVFDFTRPNL